MKLLSHYLLIVLGLFVFSEQLKGQEEVAPLIQNIRIAPQMETYSVSATNDTSFVYEVELILNDTMAFSSVQIQISEKNGNEWQTTQNVTRNAPDASNTVCQQPACIYRRNENVWLIYLGYDSLSKQSKVKLHFNNPVLNDWSREF